ncbi:reverse transcriptase domain-containing protein [Tanacetum coccineum]
MNNNQGPPPTGPIPQNPAPDLRIMEELCQPSMNGRDGLIAPVNIQATDFGLKNHMSQQVQQSCQYHGLPGDDANKHIDKFLIVTHSMKQNGVPHGVLRLCLFPYSLTHHATAFGPHYYSKCQAAGGFTQGDVYAAMGNYNAGVISTQSGITLTGQSVPSLNPLSSSSKEVERDPETTMDQLAPASKSNEILERNPHQPLIPYPSRLKKDKLQDKFDIHKFLHMFKKLHFNISFAKALAQMPKYAKMLKDLFTNKEKILELANTPLNENCSAALLKKLPEKLEDLRKFLIPCDFSELEECLALADLAEDVFMQVRKFTFPAVFVVVDYDVDAPVSIILGRPFLRTACALVDVHGEEFTLRFGDEKLIFNDESTSQYPQKHGNESIDQIDIIDTTCEDHFHEVLNVQKLIHPLSDSPTPYFDPVVASLSPSLNPFGDSDFLLEDTDAFLALDDSIPPKIDNGIYDLEGDILFLEKLLIDDPVTIPRASEKPLDSLDPISKTFEMTITNPLFDFDSEFTLNSDNPIFDIQNEESDKSETEIIMEEVQIHSS